jgi:hypothetical protein
MDIEGAAPSAVAAVETDLSLMYFPVSLRKLVVMSICTLGLYEVYWQFCHWAYIRDYEKSNISPGWRGLTWIVFCYPLFRRIRRTSRLKELPATPSAGPLALGWIFFVLLGPTPLFFLSFFSVLFLLPVQKAANSINAQIDPDHDPNDKFSFWNKVAIVFGGLTVILAFVGVLLGPR